MRKIFIGLVFIFFNFSLTSNSMLINLIPDFIGFWFISKGAFELSKHNIHFKRLYKLAMILFTLHMIIYVSQFLGLHTKLQAQYPLIWTQVSATVLMFFVLNLLYVTKGIRELNDTSPFSNRTNSLTFLWWAISLSSSMTFFFSVMQSTLAFIFLIVGFVVHIIYLYQLHKITQEYNLKI